MPRTNLRYKYSFAVSAFGELYQMKSTRTADYLTDLTDFTTNVIELAKHLGIPIELI